MAIRDTEKSGETVNSEGVNDFAEAVHPQSLHQVPTPVNTARSDSEATVCDVDLELRTRRLAQGKRLARARAEAGYPSARDAALNSGWKESTYRTHEAGSRTMGVDDAERYAKKFRSKGARVTGKWILYGDEADMPSFNLLDRARVERTFAQILRLVSHFPNPEALAAKAAEALLDPEFSPDDDDAWLKYLGKHHPILSASEKAAPEK